MSNSNGTREMETFSVRALEKQDTPPAEPPSTTLKPGQIIDCTAESEGMAFQMLELDTPNLPRPKV
jgi:hypothetical protein